MSGRCGSAATMSTEVRDESERADCHHAGRQHSALAATCRPHNTNERITDMGKIVISENVTLDGVIQDPAGVEGFRLGGWIGRIGERGREEAAKVALDEALGAEAFLLGRRSYEFLAARWPSRSGPLADRLNSLPKYVVSSTLDAPVWNNTTVISGAVINKVSNLKREIDGEILVAASF